VLLSLLGNALTQGSFVSDLEVLKSKYSKQVFHKIPSPDTVEYVCQHLKQSNIIKVGPTGVKHELNYDNKFNQMLIGLGIQTKQLILGEQGYIMYFDNVVMENEKQDAKLSYKKTKGYHPNIAFIGRIPVQIENHNGNIPACFEQKQTLERCFENLQKYNIAIEHFRADSASYQTGVIETVEKNAKYIYIRMMDFEDIRQECSKIEQWKTIRINHQTKEAASIFYQPANCNKAYRIVVTRHKQKDGQVDLLSGSAYNYQGTITNNQLVGD